MPIDGQCVVVDHPPPNPRLPHDNCVASHDMGSRVRSYYDAFRFDEEGPALAVSLDAYLTTVHSWKIADGSELVCQAFCLTRCNLMHML